MKAITVLSRIGSYLESGKEVNFFAFGASRGFQAKLVGGKVTSWEMWGDGGQMCHLYPEPVSSKYAAVCVIKALVDDKEGDPQYVSHTKEFYGWLESSEGKKLCAEAKWKEE